MSGIIKIHWLARQWLMWRVLRLETRLGKPDTIYCMRSDFSVVGWLLARAVRAHLVQRQYGTWAHYHFKQAPNWRGKLSSLGSVLAFKLPTDLFIMTNDGSDGDKVAQMAHFPLGKFRFWLNGVDKNLRISGFDGNKLRSKYGIGQDQPIILYLGRLARWKRVERVIEAFPKILARVPNAVLTVAGDGIARQDLEKQARTLGIAQRVVFTGAIGQSEATELYNLAAVVCLVHDLTNLSNTLLEAISAGCCVVTYDVGSTTLVAKDGRNAKVLSAADLAYLGERIADLLEDEDARRGLREGAYLYAQENLKSWDERMKMEIQELNALL
ncbi:MAG: glycosyltransferase family 4 protein [Bacillota bacterium]